MGLWFWKQRREPRQAPGICEDSRGAWTNSLRWKELSGLSELGWEESFLSSPPGDGHDPKGRLQWAVGHSQRVAKGGQLLWNLVGALLLCPPLLWQIQVTRSRPLLSVLALASSGLGVAFIFSRKCGDSGCSALTEPVPQYPSGV